MNYNIAVIKGDGIGPEVIDQTLLVLDKIAEKFGHTFNYNEVLMGGCAYEQTCDPLPKETVEVCKNSNAVLLGAVGGPKWDTLPGHLRPEAALLGIRSALELYANIRPAVLFEPLKNACPLRADIADDGKYGPEAYDTECYSEMEVERIARIAFETARKRAKRVISIDKANVLESGRIWREVVHRVAADYPDVSVSDMLVDNAAMQLVKNPAQFDVVLASNMFGDILSDEAAMITGSIGILASASLGESTRGLYEPIHGSAPDIAGQDKANPIATILSAAMMLKYSFGLMAESKAIEDAVDKVLRKGIRTNDIKDENTSMVVGCKQMGEAILNEI